MAAAAALAAGAAGCLGPGSSVDVPRGFPAAVVPEDGRLIGCSRQSECWFLVPGDSHRTYVRLADSARSAGWGRFSHVRGLGVDVLVAWKSGDEMKIIVTPGGSHVDARTRPRLPSTVPAGSGLVDISWGRAEDGM